MILCSVCSSDIPKYKCPKCLENYCSVKCCQAHRVVCSEQPKEKTVLSRVPPMSMSYTDGLPPKPGKLEDEEERNDGVPDTAMQQLDCPELRMHLHNPHLRAMLENLVNADNPQQAMDKAMREPIFQEFAITALGSIEPNNPHLEPDD